MCPLLACSQAGDVHPIMGDLRRMSALFMQEHQKSAEDLRDTLGLTKAAQFNPEEPL